MKANIIAIVLSFSCIISFAQTEIIRWNNGLGANYNSCYSSSNPNELTTGGGVSNWTGTSVGGAQGQYFYATNWNNGANSKYWKVHFSSEGWSSLTVSSKQRSTDLGFVNWTGPRDFKLQYSLDNSNWTDVVNIPALADNWTSGVINNVSLPSACDNQTDVYLRWIMYSNTPVSSSGSFGSEAQSMIDDIYIYGSEAAQAPTDITLSNTLLASGSPSGTTVGVLSSTDPNCSSGTFTYSLVSGTGSTDNSSFTIDNDTVKTATSLSEGTYSIRIQTNDGTYSFQKAFTVTVSAYPPITLLDPNDNGYNWITNVSLGDIDNSSGSNGEVGYTDFTTQSTTLRQGASDSLSVTFYTNDTYGGQYVDAYFDWNQDGDFLDAGEKFTLLSNLPQNTTGTLGPYTTVINVPADADTGTTRMRITSHYNALYGGTTSGGNVDYGEAEDYTIVIQPGAGVVTWSGNGDWSDDASTNWNIGGEPSTSDSVVISNGTINVTTDIEINSVSVESGASLNVGSGNTLTINGTYTDNGGSLSASGGGTVEMKGDLKKGSVKRVKTFSTLKILGGIKLLN